MIAAAAHVLFILAMLFASVSTNGASQSTEQPLVKFVGLSDTYHSCALVRFSVENISHRELYVQIFAENFRSDSWVDVPYPYDLTNLSSLYNKIVVTNPDMLQPGKSIAVSYHRCLRPRFVKLSTQRFAGRIEQEDKEAIRPVLQRIRAEVVVRENGKLRLFQKVFSNPFTRVPTPIGAK